MRFVVAGLVALLVVPAAPPVAAQDSLVLADAYAAAVSHDPRAAEYALLERSLSLRLENLSAEWLPRLSVSGEATHQSDVPSFEIPVPGATPPRPPKDRYRATLDVDQLLYEGGALSARRGVARAEVERERAELATRLYELRAEVDAAYFGALALQEQETELGLLVTDLEAGLAEASAQVAEGALLPGEAAALEAELLAARQRGRELAARRRAAVAVLADLTGLTLAADVRLALPSLAARVVAADSGLEGGELARPELARLEAESAVLERRRELIEADARPMVSAFGQTGYGRPGLDLFGTEPDTWWQAGIRLRWAPWEWGTRDRERETLRLRQRGLDAERAAFVDRLGRSVADERALIRVLRAGLETDRRIVALREQIEAQQLARLEEGAILPSAYVDARTDVTEARVALRRRRVEIARLEAAYLTLLGARIR